MRKRFDHIAFGLFPGLLLPLIGFWIYFKFTFGQGMGLGAFLDYQADNAVKMLAVGCVLNLGAFFLFLQTDRYRSARGVVMATLAYAMFIVYMKFIAS